MAPLEDSTGIHRLAEPRPIDSLMRALLYIVQQIGRPLSEADVRGLAVLADEPLDERGFLTAGTRLGLHSGAIDLAKARLEDLPTPFAVAGGGLAAHVVAAGRGGQWTVLDVVEGRVFNLTADDVRTLGTRALVLREKLAREQAAEWYAPLWARVRPVVAKLAFASLLINLLGLATPLFMMVVLNRVIGHGVPQSIVPVMAVLAAAMLGVYALDFSLRVARGWLSARAGANLDTLMSA